jgi:2-octaprenyl-6-methoxyphenol hydroxylase
LNLGFKDSAALAEVLGEAAMRGEDIGDLNVLRRYERWRRFDNTSMALGMDVLNRLFSNDIAPLRLLRDMGIAAVGKVGPLRRMFMRQAAGMTPGLPKVMQAK